MRPLDPGTAARRAAKDRARERARERVRASFPGEFADLLRLALDDEGRPRSGSKGYKRARARALRLLVGAHPASMAAALEAELLVEQAVHDESGR